MPVRLATVDRRRIARPRRRVEVRYGDGSTRHLGYTLEMGDKGLFLQGNHLYPPGAVINMDIELQEGLRSFRGVVRWVKEVAPAFRRSLRGGMGIELIDLK